ACDVRAFLALCTPFHLGVDPATTLRRGTLLIEALVFATPSEHLDTGVDAGLEVEHHGVVGVADQHGIALDRAEFDQALLDAEAVEPVGEEADGFVVAEVSLTHPTLGLRAADPPTVAGLLDRELLAPVGGLGTQHDPSRF